ncbi:GDP-mannose 4,6 dehydratase 1 [Olea europaea subsp. europaea]|uniref:GDP-mannose 4,6-dehydratase n=1 Tax=Olea europaea subsp. europaea TaxID=158383 RepID=A0A8S0T3G2_OLEEU|nr:GDP-mannose 4,6 dehydratase 1 [Olea europaea subsp. europaea]
MATDSRSEATADNGTENPVPSPSPPLQFSCIIALITGITGQDGAYLTEFLLNKGYEVRGLIRKSSNFSIERINHIYIDPHNAHKERMKLHYADLNDASSLCRWLDTIQPDEVYNLAAQSHVVVSFEIPDYIADVVATDALRLLEAVRSHISASGRSHIRYSQRVRLRSEVDNLKGIATKAKKVLGWKPIVGFEQLVKMMVDEDIELAKREKVLVDAGYMDAQQQP